MFADFRPYPCLVLGDIQTRRKAAVDEITPSLVAIGPNDGWNVVEPALFEEGTGLVRDFKPSTMGSQ